MLDRIIKILTEGGTYRPQPRLVIVDDVDFEFDAILRGPGDSHGLVLVMDCPVTRLPLAVSRVRAFSQMMLRTGSIRPLSVVAVTELDEPGVLNELSAICRVIRVVDGDDASVRARLRPLLPLILPEPESPQGDVSRLLRKALETVTPEELVSSLINAGRKDDKAVESAIVEAINSAITQALSEGQ